MLQGLVMWAAAFLLGAAGWYVGSTVNGPGPAALVSAAAGAAGGFLAAGAALGAWNSRRDGRPRDDG